MKKIIYVDMDNVLVDFPTGIAKLDETSLEKYKGAYDDTPGIFSLMEPVTDAIESVTFLSNHFDVYILSTAPWENSSAWSDKLLWIKKYLPQVMYKKLIISHNKHLNKGDYLIDDRLKNGADRFTGELIQFGQEKFKTWKIVIDYLVEKENLK